MNDSASPPLPDWYTALCALPNYQPLVLNSWETQDWLMENNYMHSPNAPCRVLGYALNKDDNSLHGVAHFSPKCQGHYRVSHGGTMTSLMDDAIGWCGFCVSGQLKTWVGFTAQINTALKKSVPTGAVLKLEANILRREGPRKVWIAARLIDPITNDVFCTADGLFLLPKDEQTPAESK